MTDTGPSPDSSNRNQILKDAWLRFAKYDTNAVIAQKRFIQQRKWILALGVLSATLGVVYSLIQKQVENDKTQLPFGITMADVFHFPVLVVPIILSVLVAISVKFNMGINWVMLRSSAEAIRKEIFRYRMQVGEYNPAKVTPGESRDVRLSRSLKTISKRLMQTPVNQTDLLIYQGPLPPDSITKLQDPNPFSDANPFSDDGFSDLTAEHYLELRVENQLNYYQKKAVRLGRDLRRFQLLIFLLSGLGTLLAGLKLDVWIAVSSALVAAFTGYLEFKRAEATVISCNVTAADLYDIRVWWHALSDEAKTEAANVETLVSITEGVLQAENAGWLQDMREALAEIYGEKKKDKSETECDPSLSIAAINAPFDPAAITKPPIGTATPPPATHSAALPPENDGSASPSVEPDTAATPLTETMPMVETDASAGDSAADAAP